MFTLTRAKAALLLAALLVTSGIGQTAIAAPWQSGTQQTLGIVALRHAADGVQTRIYLEGTAELPYTIYRPDERTILVDLPGADASKLEDAYDIDSRGVERIQVERLRTASGQSLARLRIRLKASVEDRTVVEGKNLVVTLTSTAAAPAPAASPAAAKETAPSMQAEVPAAKPPVVAPTQPLTTAAVPSNAASNISAIRTEVKGGTFRAFVATDGRASFKHFVLTSPDRIVVDITGVTSRVDRNSIDVAGGGISRIRIGQFRTADPRVVRIVFDVNKMGPYDVRQVGNDLVLSLGGQSGADVASTPQTVKPAAASSTRRPEPVAAPTPKPAPPPVVGNDDPADNPAAVKPSVRHDMQEPLAPASKPEVQRPTVMASSAPVQPVAEEVDTQKASGRPSPQRAPATTSAARPQPSTAQAPPPAPMVPKTQGSGNYMSEGFVGRPVNLELKNVDLRDVLRFLHNKFGVNFIVDRSVPASVPVDVSVKDIPWNQALDAVLKSQGLGTVREQGGIVRIAGLQSIADERDAQRRVEESYYNTLPLQTKIYRLKYALTTAKHDGPTGQWWRRRRKRGGRSTRPQYRKDRYLCIHQEQALVARSYRVRQPFEQHYRDGSPAAASRRRRDHSGARQAAAAGRDRGEIVVARRTFFRDLGVQLASTVNNQSRGGQILTSSNGLLPPTVGTPTAPVASSTGSLFTLTTGAIGTFQITATIVASERKGQIRTIAAPRVTTQNNTTATVTNGVQIPVQTVSNNTVTTTFVDAALRLEITPQIIVEDGAVLLTVTAENNNVSTLRVSGTTPGIDTQSAEAVVLVPDGGTTVLGGINIDAEDQSDDRTPGLARIPIFGNLFKRRTTNRNTSEILFFITPRIFRPELVGLTQESTTRTNDITITPVLPVGSEGGSGVLPSAGTSGPGTGGVTP